MKAERAVCFFLGAAPHPEARAAGLRALKDGHRRRAFFSSFEAVPSGRRLRMRAGIFVKALLAAFLFAFTAPSLAVEPDEILEDPALEQRARDLGRELRCITCQSQSIDDSNAPLARDLRIVVRERIVAGDTDEEVMAYVTGRYGDYVRLRPEMRADTALLWLTPALALLAGIGAVFFYMRNLPKGDDEFVGEDDFDDEKPAV